jgi:hypothetical protein
MQGSNRNEENAMFSPVIGYCLFATRGLRIIYEDREGQYIINDDNQRLYGLWLVPENAGFKLPLPTGLEGLLPATVSRKA